MNREYHRWYSPRLHRDMELLIFGHAGAPVLVFPSRGGRFFEYENWGMVRALQSKIEQGWLQLFCVDSIDLESLYCQCASPHDRIARHNQYESYILHEVLPAMRLVNPNPFTISHGCSLGAFHAVNIAFRHPHLFGKVVAFSGRYDLTGSVGPFRSLFDGYYSEDIYFHTPNHYVPNLTAESILHNLRKMEIILAIGEDDPFLDSNDRLSTSLWSKGVWNAVHKWPGEAHRPRYWRPMAQQYL